MSIGSKIFRGSAWIALAIIFAPIALLSSFIILSEIPTGSVRFRVTAEITTPDGVRTGSSVLQSSFYRTVGAVSGATAKLRGEAVFIELGAGRNVVVLLAHGPMGEGGDAFAALPVTALTGAGWGWNAKKAMEERGGSLSGSADLTGLLIPTMVTVPDLKDPTSVRVLYATSPKVVCEPAGNCAPKVVGVEVVDRFEDIFGRGYGLKRINVEVVPRGIWPLNALGIWGAPITDGIEEKLPWWNFRDRMTWETLCAPRAETPFAECRQFMINFFCSVRRSL